MTPSEPFTIMDSEIPDGYSMVSNRSGTQKSLSYLDRFEARSARRDFTNIGNVRDETAACDDDKYLVGIESQDEMRLCFTGFIVKCSDAKQYSQTKDESLLEKPENRMYYTFCEDSTRWAFDYSQEERGIWFENENGWFKLMNPSKKYKPIYDPFYKNIDQGYSTIISLLKERHSVEESYVMEQATFILNNCQHVEFAHIRLSSTKFAKEFREKIIAEKERAVQEEKERIEREKKEELEKIERERRETEQREQLERQNQLTTQQNQQILPQSIKVKKELPKIKPLSANLAKPKPQINPLVVPYIERLCMAAQEEADQGELSDSGDRDPFFSSYTVCNFCNIHRPELMACKECGEYLLCSVCFYRLELDKNIPTKFLEENISPFEVCGKREMFVCRECHSKLNGSEESEHDSQESVELDRVQITDEEQEENDSPQAKKSKKSTSTVGDECHSKPKKRGRRRKEPEKNKEPQNSIPSEKVRATRRKKLSDALAVHDIDHKQNKKLAIEIEKAILKKPNPEFSNGDHAAAIVKLLKNKNIVSQLLDGSLSVSKLVSFSSSELKELSKKRIKK
nr:unnamed protein product [Naegleria fowleri]